MYVNNACFVRFKCNAQSTAQRYNILNLLHTVKLPIEAECRTDAGPRIQAGGLIHLYW